jgi:di/tricarboxylate transporter
MTPSNGWEIPRAVWFILLSWGLALMIMTGLLSFWISSNEREQDRQNDRVQHEQDRAMCVMLDLFTSGPPPVAGEAGERGRAVLVAMNAYRATLNCEALPPR